MNHTKIKPLAIILVSSFCFLLVAKMAVDYSLNSLLTRHANAIGRDWAHYLDDRLGEELPAPSIDEKAAALSDGRLGVLVDAVSDLLVIGNIFQIDFIDVDCSCFASFSNESHFQQAASDSPTTGQLPIQMTAENRTSGHHPEPMVGEPDHQHILRADSRFTDEFHGRLGDVDYVYSFGILGQMQDEAVGETRPGFLPINQVAVNAVWNNKLHVVTIPHDNAESSRHSIAEIYHKIQRGDETKLVLRLLADMDVVATRNRAIMYLASATILLLLILSFGYPAARHFENLRTRRKSDAKAHFLANHDVLTGLSNRNAFQENVPERLKDSISQGRSGALFLIDIDNFKRINDFYGHHVGDQVLRQIAGLLKDQVRPTSVVARLGGDELAIVSFHEGLEDDQQLGEFALPSTFRVDLDDSEETLDVSFSVGISRFPRDGTELSELMRNADLALYDAKNRGKSTVREYLPEMKVGFHQRQVLFNEFRAGLKLSQILPFYQPVVCVRTGRVAGVEALVRWQHPQKGLVRARDFSEVFEDREICELIGCQMIDKVTQDMARWKDSNVPFERVGFNVNAANLMRDGFVLDIISSLARHGLSPKELAIEVTEKTTFGTNSKALFEKLHELREMGCEVVLDDFGTGYSSITHLKELPYTFLKIARTFISNIVEDPEDQAIVSSLIELGTSLNYKVVAEGVETYEQYEKIRQLGFHLSQGYYYSEPVSADDLPLVIDNLRARSFRNFKPQEYHEDVA